MDRYLTMISKSCSTGLCAVGRHIGRNAVHPSLPYRLITPKLKGPENPKLRRKISRAGVTGAAIFSSRGQRLRLELHISMGTAAWYVGTGPASPRFYETLQQPVSWEMHAKKRQHEKQDHPALLNAKYCPRVRRVAAVSRPATLTFELWPDLEIQWGSCGSRGTCSCKISSSCVQRFMPYFWGSRSLNVIDVDTPGKFVSSACYDQQQACVYLQPLSC